MLTADGTYQIDALARFLQPVAAEVRLATDLLDASPQLSFLDDTVLQGTDPSSSPTEPPTMAPWLIDTLQIIDNHRRRLRASGDAASHLHELRALETAEMLSSFLVDVAPEHRPQLNIDSEGVPSFATAGEGFYLHLTVDGPGKLTWYCVGNGAEYFDEGVAFDGRRLPPALQAIFGI